VVATSPTTANLLRDLRRRQGTSLRTAAADIGIAPSQLSRLERGQRGIAHDMSDRLSKYYDVPADVIALMSGTIPDDIIEILKANPELITRLRSEYGDAG